jgi:hypothetical protein
MDDKHSYLNREGNDVKDLHEVRHKFKETRELSGRKVGPISGLVRTPFDLDAPRLIYSLYL